MANEPLRTKAVSPRGVISSVPCAPTWASIASIGNAAVGVWQESSADGALDALKKLQPDRCCCRRRGAWDGEVPASDLAPGDVVYLRVGDKVPADVRLLQLRTSTFATDEAALTGESYTVMKSVDAVDDPDCPLGTRTSMAFAGTVVTGGHAIGVVAATGMATQIGRIQAGVTAAAADQQKTPLSQKLDEFGHQLTLIIGSVCALTFGASFTLITRTPAVCVVETSDGASQTNERNWKKGSDVDGYISVVKGRGRTWMVTSQWLREGVGRGRLHLSG